MKTFAWAALALVIGACDSGESQDPHPTDRVDFPVSVTADPSGDLVWVVSGNFDLRFRSSAVLAIDTATNTFVDALAFEIGGFPGPFKLFEKNGRATAGYITSRAQDRLYWVTFGGDDPSRPTVACPGGEESGGILRCPKDQTIDEREVDTKDGKVTLSLGADPFGLEIIPNATGCDPDRTTPPCTPDLLLTGAMGDGVLATLELAADGTPELVGSATLFDGLFSLTRNPVTGRIFATSKLANAVSTLDIAPRFDPEKPGQNKLDPVNPYITNVTSFTIPEPSSTDRARVVAISPDGTRLYVAYRAPDSLIVVDIADSATGGQRQRVLQKIPLDDDPQDLVVVKNPNGLGDLVYVSCFKADRVEIVDPQIGEIIGGVHTGDGPSGIAIVDKPGLHRLYVALFNDDAVGVIELDPASPYYHTEIAEIR